MTAVRIDPAWRLPERLTTPESVWLDRRRLLRTLGILGLGQWALGAAGGCAPGRRPPATADPARLTEPALGERHAERFPAPRDERYGVGARPVTAERTAAGYNNFYEFTTDKERVWELAQGYPVEPWTVAVRGLVERPRELDLDFLMTRFPLEERLYRFRCVERWAMQVPWTGFPLARLIDELAPLSAARYVRFVSVHDPEGLPGQRSYHWYPWPYYEALRLDEARNELAFVVVGAYGHALPMQHGAPWRLALPWKYGYKGPKSVVAIELTADQPPTFWNDAVPDEYGFYSNVDPDKPHPRWSQARERDIGTGEERPTLPYNGYAEQVSGMYHGGEF